MRLRDQGGPGYTALHHAIWPEMLEELDRAGYRDYSIFVDDTRVFGAFDCDDIGHVTELQKTSPVMARWRNAVAQFACNQPNPASPGPALMTPIFHCAGSGTPS